MNRPSTFRRFDAGYTLFEIMLVLGIIAVLVGSAIYMLKGNIDVAKQQRAETDFTAIVTQLKTYEMMNYNFPTTAQGLDAMVTRPTTEPVPRRWVQLLDKGLIDPWGQPYNYASPGKKNPASFDLFSSGPDKQAGTADDISYSGN
ncbi:MAG TPA: type II secretion system major pseudopilin GspG [Chthoniobacterales bacterium]|jgi:general secretion pathway protein G|nr:type II secretion system major pseudopilin GspG [Chthoniobacterales bacterium]